MYNIVIWQSYTLWNAYYSKCRLLYKIITLKNYYNIVDYIPDAVLFLPMTYLFYSCKFVSLHRESCFEYLFFTFGFQQFDWDESKCGCHCISLTWIRARSNYSGTVGSVFSSIWENIWQILFSIPFLLLTLTPLIFVRLFDTVPHVIETGLFPPWVLQLRWFLKFTDPFFCVYNLLLTLSHSFFLF